MLPDDPPSSPIPGYTPDGTVLVEPPVQDITPIGRRVTRRETLVTGRELFGELPPVTRRRSSTVLDFTFQPPTGSTDYQQGLGEVL